MCQENYNTEKTNFKSLSEYELGIIQNGLTNNQKIASIAKEIGKDSSTIRKAIKRYSVNMRSSPKCTDCSKFPTCRKEKLCEVGEVHECGYCKGCSIAVENCIEFSPVVNCEHLKGHRLVCNGCKNFKQCRKTKIVFKADIAINKQKDNKKNSLKKRKIEKLSKEDRDEFDRYVSSKIEKNISVKVILACMPEELKEKISVSTTTLYSYIDACLLKCRNIDLVNKLKRKVKSETKKETSNRGKHRENGRSVHDITEKQLKSVNIFEMDTVEGQKGKELLLTIITKNEHFMFGLPISSKHSINVEKQLDKLEETLGSELFKQILTIGVTDNGCEFLNFEGLERSIKSTYEEPVKRLNIHYADPYASYQKPLVENNHRLIRYILEKGYDMSNLTKEQILNIMNRINNYPREVLNYSTPYLEIAKVIDKDILKKLGFYYISIDDLDMKNKVIDKIIA